MNRTQYEKLHPRKKKEPCKLCQYREDSRTRLLLAKRKKQKAFRDALNRAIENGKVISVFEVDDFTGWHYINYKGRYEFTGSGGN